MQVQQKEQQANKKQIIQKFQQNGFMLRPKALEMILGQDIDQLIQNSKFLYKFESILDIEHIKEALGLQNHSQQNDLSNLLDEKLKNSVVIVNSVLDFRQTIIKDGIISFQNIEGSYFGEPQDLIDMNLKKFLIIKEKLKKSKNYNFQFEKKINADIQIIDISSLNSQNGFQYTFGIIVEQDNGIYYLQDQYSKVLLDLKDCQPSIGFINPGFTYIVYGEYNDGFIVQQIMHPQIQTANETIEFFGNQDYFGCQEKIKKFYGQILQIELQHKLIKENQQEKKAKKLTLDQQRCMNIYELQQFQKQIQDPMIIVISDFLIEKSEVIIKFKKLIDGIKDFQPVAFILMGSFSTINEIKDNQDQMQYLQGFQQFIDILDNFPIISQNSYFIFVPSPNDIGMGIMPQKQAILQSNIIEQLEKKLPYFINASNPCRLSIYGKQILISKNNLLKDMRKKQIVQPTQNFSFDQHLVLTVLSQMVLYFPDVYNFPVFLQYVDSLQVIQLPDIIILGDSLCSQYKQETKGCQVFNPGNFSKNGSFCMLKLNSSQIDCCSL